MRKLHLFALIIAFQSCSSQDAQHVDEPSSVSLPTFSLDHFYSENQELDSLTDAWYNELNDTQRVAQMIMSSAGELGKPKSTVARLATNGHIGGVLFLRGELEGNKSNVALFDSLATSNGHPSLFFSIDAEPSLYNRRVKGSKLDIPSTHTLQTAESNTLTAHSIDEEIKYMGFNWNFAPVLDVSANQAIINKRSYGPDSTHVVSLSIPFIQATQEDQVIATAKHFPGHGRVTGDTHKERVIIDGELTEKNYYKPVIDSGVLSIMVAHITVVNNESYDSKDLPAICSPRIVSQLLRQEMGFEGLIVTDAMNMAAAELPNAPLMAAIAGCDIILMPPNELQLIEQILELQKLDSDFAGRTEASIKRILRMKLCLNLK